MPTESERQRDTRIRLTVFAWLEEQTEIHGDVLPWSLLAHGLYIDGERVPLVSQQRIWTPARRGEVRSTKPEGIPANHQRSQSARLRPCPCFAAEASTRPACRLTFP